MAQICLHIHLTLLKGERDCSRRVKETQISRKIVQDCGQQICISTDGMFLKDITLIFSGIEHELKRINLSLMPNGNGL